MAHASFYFHGALSDFLPRPRRQRQFTHPFDHIASIKDMIESLGVPHPEVDVIVVNGSARDFSYLVQTEDVVEVYPPHSPHLPSDALHLCPEPAEPRFVLDVHLGKLAAFLRMLGFDTLYRNDYDDDELALISSQEDRILLSRDLGVLKRGIVQYGYFPRNTDPDEQLLELIRRYQLTPHIRPFTRCIECNSPLLRVEKATILEELSPKTRDYYHEFYRCARNGKIYWKGSHYERMRGFIGRVLQIQLP